MKLKTLLAEIAISVFCLSFLSAEPQVQMLDSGTGGYLGVRIRDVAGEDVKKLQLSREGGVFVEAVEPDSPASSAGLKEGDVVLEYGPTAVTSVRQFQRLVSETPAGRSVELKVAREGKQTSVAAVIGEREKSSGLWFSERPRRLEELPGPGRDFFIERLPDFGHSFSFSAPRSRLGIQAATLTKQMAEFLEVTGGKGVLVMEVAEGSPAQKAGLKAGDAITAVDGTAVESPGELREKLSDGKHEVDLIRRGKKQRVTVGLEEPESKPAETIRM